MYQLYQNVGVINRYHKLYKRRRHAFKVLKIDWRFLTSYSSIAFIVLIPVFPGAVLTARLLCVSACMQLDLVLAIVVMLGAIFLWTSLPDGRSTGRM